MAVFDEDTVESKSRIAFAERLFASSEPQLELRIAAATHVGKVRLHNEDHYAVIRNTRSRKVLLTNLPNDGLSFPEDESYGMVVADGIGGAASGDVASQLALQTMFELAGRATSWVMKITDLEAQQIHQRVEAYVNEIQRTLRFYTETDPKLAGMGTTWTSAHVLGPHAIVVHIGDSRAYLYRDAALRLITRDQTLGQEMVEAGMPEDNARRFGHLLTNSLGGNKEAVPADIYHVELQPGDRLLLCTDGLSDMVAASSVAEVMRCQSEPQAACNEMIERALDGGGRDNITVILCDVTAASEDRS
jgi:serine/threonine protein phosphatase PrpC